jgi:hypothetical protein
VRQVISKKLIHRFENDHANDVAQALAEHQIRGIPVLNRDKRLVGMVALAELGPSEIDAVKTALVTGSSGNPWACPPFQKFVPNLETQASTASFSGIPRERSRRLLQEENSWPIAN